MKIDSLWKLFFWGLVVSLIFYLIPLFLIPPLALFTIFGAGTIFSISWILVSDSLGLAKNGKFFWILGSTGSFILAIITSYFGGSIDFGPSDIRYSILGGIVGTMMLIFSFTRYSRVNGILITPREKWQGITLGIFLIGLVYLLLVCVNFINWQPTSIGGVNNFGSYNYYFQAISSGLLLLILVPLYQICMTMYFGWLVLKRLNVENPPINE